jgi:phage gpG-like protein
MSKSFRVILRIDLDFENVKDSLEDIRRRSKDFRPVFKDIQKDLEELWSNNFLEMGLPSGGWKPLDAEYGSWKSRNVPGAPIMQRSGTLFRSLATLRGNPNQIRLKSATFGTDVKYADFHQTGTKNMPARPVVFVPEKYERKWSRMAADYMANG